MKVTLISDRPPLGDRKQAVFDALNRAKAGQRRIPSDTEYSGLLAKCAQSLKLAEEISDPGWVLECKLIMAIVRMDKIL